jgi:hypothetical protein
MLSREQLQRAAADSGFQVESYEKAHVLVRLLDAVRTECKLKLCPSLKKPSSASLPSAPMARDTGSNPVAVSKSHVRVGCYGGLDEWQVTGTKI